MFIPYILSPLYYFVLAPFSTARFVFTQNRGSISRFWLDFLSSSTQLTFEISKYLILKI